MRKHSTLSTRTLRSLVPGPWSLVPRVRSLAPFSSRRRGNSLTECLAAVAGVGVLAGIGVVAFGGRAAESKSKQAAIEVEALAHAEIDAAKRFGYMVPLQTLDDFPTVAGASELRDDAGNEPESLRVIDPAQAPEAQSGKQPAFRAKAADWKAPAYEARRIYLGPTGDMNKALSDAGTIRRDYPVDPWGTPYRTYSPIGIVGTTAADPATIDKETFSDGVLTQTEDRFDSYAIVSFGPDGKSDAVTNANDDVIYLFDAPGAAKAAGAQSR